MTLQDTFYLTAIIMMWLIVLTNLVLIAGLIYLIFAAKKLAKKIEDKLKAIDDMRKHPDELVKRFSKSVADSFVDKIKSYFNR